MLFKWTCAKLEFLVNKWTVLSGQLVWQRVHWYSDILVNDQTLHPHRQNWFHRNCHWTYTCHPSTDSWRLKNRTEGRTNFMGSAILHSARLYCIITHGWRKDADQLSVDEMQQDTLVRLTSREVEDEQGGSVRSAACKYIRNTVYF